MPIGQNTQREVRQDDLVDVRDDYFLDIRTSLKAKVTSKIGFSIEYRYLYDNAPNRVFLTEGFAEPTLLVGQQKHHIYLMKFEFKF